MRWRPFYKSGTDRPWTQPGYTGRLKETISIDPNDYKDFRPDIEDMIGVVLELMIRGEIPREFASKLLTHYDQLKEEGHDELPERIH